MEWRLDSYKVNNAEQLITPALLIYPKIVDDNIRATLAMVGGDANRWRPHIKTTKLGAIVRRMLEHGIQNFKCSTTLELLMACQVGAADVLVAFAVTGANARRVVEIAREYPKTRVSVLVESSVQAALWRDTGIGVFIDVNSGMNRTGMDQTHAEAIRGLASEIGTAFRGLHWYDGHIKAPAGEAGKDERAYAGYDRLMGIVAALDAAGIPVEEVITSGTPAMPYGIAYPGFSGGKFIHRISPGTVVYNDTSSLQQLPDAGYAPAVVVLASVISHPLPQQITCDAGHKSVSVDSGVPNCVAIGHAGFKPLKPSEEHLPIDTDGDSLPAIGEKLYLIPRHVCPTVNNFDQALMVVDGEIVGVEAVTARGHEDPTVGLRKGASLS